MNTILVAYDQTDASDRALERAAEFAKAFAANVVVTSIAPVLTGRAGGIDPVDPPDAHEAQLDHALELLKESGVEGRVLLAIGNPADGIIRVAEDVQADLIVVGTREPDFIDRLFGGSVSGAVGRKAHCDVLIVH